MRRPDGVRVQTCSLPTLRRPMFGRKPVIIENRGGAGGTLAGALQRNL